MTQYYPKVGVCYDHAEASKIYLIYTYACNAACAHCLVESTPARREKLTVAEGTELLTAAAARGKSFLLLSGGEAMLFPREVEDLARVARDLGYYVCLNTNGFWAKSPAVAVETVRRLADSGVQAIFPSTSAYHRRFVPVERVRSVRDACRAVGVAYELNFFDSTDTATDAALKETLGLAEEVYFFDGLVTVGNDESEIARLAGHYRRRTPDELDDCLSIHLGANPFGQVVTSCNMTRLNEKFVGTPFFLGNFREESFDDILDREEASVVLQFLYRNPHPALHQLLRTDDATADYYEATFVPRRYFNVVDFYVDVLTDPVVGPRVEPMLADRLAGGLIAPPSPV